MDSGSHNRLFTSSPLYFCISLSLLGSIALAAAPTERMLADGTGLSGLTLETPFGDAIDMLKYSVDPPLKIVVNWRDLEDNLGIDRSTPVMMDPLSGVKLSTALSLLLWAVSGGTGELDYSVQNGVILVSTTANIRPIYRTHVYDIGTLLAQPANYQVPPLMGMMIGQFLGGGYGYGRRGYGQGYGNYNTGAYGWPANAYGPNRYGPGASTEDLADRLISIIKEAVAPDTWDSNRSDAPSATYDGGRLIVRQHPENLQKVSKVIADFRAALEPRVSLEVRFLEVPPNFLDGLGTGVFRPSESNQVDITYAAEDPNRRTQVPATLLRGRLVNQSQCQLILDAASKDKEVRMLVAPKVGAANGQPMPYPLAEMFAEDAADPNAPTPFAGLQAAIVPIANDDGAVLLTVHTMSECLPGVDLFRWAPKEQGSPLFITAAAEVPAGYSLLLAGFPTRVERTIEPLTSPLPRFSNASKVKSEQYHIILVTPRALAKEQ